MTSAKLAFVRSYFRTTVPSIRPDGGPGIPLRRDPMDDGVAA